MPEDKQKLQEKYIELQLVSTQIKQVEEQLGFLDQKAMELTNLSLSLEKFKELKPGTKSLAPLGQGIFAETSIGATNSVLLNVGAGVIVRKSVEEAGQTINGQLDNLQDVAVELGENLKMLAAKAHQLEHEIDKLL